MNLRKMIAYSLIGGMVVGVLQTGFVSEGIPFVYASSNESLSEDQSKEMEKILIDVKKRVDIPAQFTKFECGYNEWSKNPTWSFYWSTEEGYENIQVQVDKDSHIISYSKNNYGKEQERIAKYEKKKMKEKADSFLRKIEPKLYSHMELIESSYTNSYSNTYSFVYQRKENQVPVPENYVKIQVNAATGEVSSYYSEWESNAKFLNPEQQITKNEAKVAIESELEMNLEYHLVQKEGKEGYSGELVYTPNKTYLAVDASNKKVYDTKDSLGRDYEGESRNEEARDASTELTSGSAVLTEQEMKEIEEVAGLLTKKEAEEKVRSNGKFLIPSTSNVTIRLGKEARDSSNPKQFTYVYDITFRSENEDDYHSYAYATMDARTGKIYSFYTYPDYDRYSDSFAEKKVKFSKEEGQKIVDRFLKDYYGDYYTNLKYTDSSDDYVIHYNMDGIADQYGGCNYKYTRLEDGVPVIYNDFYVALDLVTGKIYRFSYTWNHNVKFEKKDKVITADKAREEYLANEEFKKVYEILPKAKEAEKYYPTRMVYRTNINPAYIDAFSGKQVYYNAEEVMKKSEIKYSDIEGTTYEKTIRLLADMNVGFTDGKFQPKKAMTVLDWNNFVNQMYRYEPDYLQMKGIGTIKREDVVKYVLNVYGLSKIAEFDIYKSDYKDENKITRGNLGYLVLGEKLGLITKDKDGNIRPQDELTREEAANIFMQMISYSNY